MATTAVIALTAASLIIGVLSAPPHNTSDTRHQWHVQPELWNEQLKQAPDSYQNNAALDAITADRRKAVRDEAKRWPNAIVPYSISSSIERLSPSALSLIKEAMSHWEKETCIRFVPSIDMKDKDLVSIVDGNWCASFVGRIGGKQTLTLAPGCLNVGTIIHELGHAIGWNHEHSRPDRDNFIEIISDKIRNSNDPSFAKSDSDRVNTFGVPYDYGSIMHYSGGSSTIKAIDPSMQKVMGQRKKLSFYDAKLANLMYKCAERNKCNADSTKCIDDGYVGPKCTCVCRDESRGCTANRSSNKPVLSISIKSLKRTRL